MEAGDAACSDGQRVGRRLVTLSSPSSRFGPQACEPLRAWGSALLSCDEARRIAANVAQLPEVLRSRNQLKG